MTEGSARDTTTAPFNDLDAVDRALDDHGDALAAVIVEPVAANMVVTPPMDGFLDGLRARCTENGSVLLFDEAITGFRIGYGGAQTRWGCHARPDDAREGDGGGFPCGAFGGWRDLMERLAPVGPVYQAGTLSGNPVAVAAGIATLDLARRFDPYPGLERTAETLATGLEAAFATRPFPISIGRAGSLLSLFFAEGPVRNFDDAKAADHDRYARFFHHLLDRGIALPPSGYELWTLGTVHRLPPSRGRARRRRVLRRVGTARLVPSRPLYAAGSGRRSSSSLPTSSTVTTLSGSRSDFGGVQLGSRSVMPNSSH